MYAEQAATLFLSPNENFIYIAERRVSSLNIIIFTEFILFNRMADGRLSRAGPTGQSPFIQSQTPLFSLDSSQVFVPSVFTGDPPSPALSIFSVNLDSGDLSDFTIALVTFGTNGARADNMLLFDQDRLFIAANPFRVYRLTEANEAVLLEDAIVNNLPFRPNGDAALAINADQALIYFGGFNGITVFRYDGLNIPPASPVPGLGISGMLIMAALLMLLGISFPRTVKKYP